MVVAWSCVSDAHLAKTAGQARQLATSSDQRRKPSVAVEARQELSANFSPAICTIRICLLPPVIVLLPSEHNLRKNNQHANYPSETHFSLSVSYLEFLQRPNSEHDAPPSATMSYADIAAKGPKQSDEEVSQSIFIPTRLSPC